MRDSPPRQLSRRRTKGPPSAKSPAHPASAPARSYKGHKHLALVSLFEIKRVVDLTVVDENGLDAFPAFLLREPTRALVSCLSLCPHSRRSTFRLHSRCTRRRGVGLPLPVVLASGYAIHMSG